MLEHEPQYARPKAFQPPNISQSNVTHVHIHLGLKQNEI